jgi:hypothetical protein
MTNALVQSIRAKLINVSKDRGSPVQQVTTLFLLERAAARLVAAPQLTKHLVFKGGYVSVRIYHSPRFTTDLDALIRGIDAEKAVQEVRNSLSLDLGDGAWFQFEARENLTTQGEYGGIRLSHRGGIGDPPSRMNRAQMINIDLGIGDVVTPAPVSASTDLIIGSGSLSWLVYPVESILAEKLHALITLGSINSRAKDVFDIAFFLQKANKATLAEALEKTFAVRGDQLPSRMAEALLEVDTTVLRRGWQSAVATVPLPPDFDSAWKGLMDGIRRMGL